MQRNNRFGDGDANAYSNEAHNICDGTRIRYVVHTQLTKYV